MSWLNVEDKIAGCKWIPELSSNQGLLYKQIVKGYSVTHTCEILEQQPITDNIYRMRIKAGEIVRSARPGQFVNIRITSGIDPLLRRPFSIHRIDSDKGEIVLLYRVIGRGTELMSKMPPGNSVDIMGPLGNGFNIQFPFDHAVIVAGGMGSAPVFFLMDELRKSDKKITLLWGAREGVEIFQENELRDQGIDLQIATENSSKGYSGFVTDLLEIYLSKHKDGHACSGFVCGPECMIKKVQEIILSCDFQWQASLEERMACGVGVCLGCAILNRKKGLQMVCKEGPVFNLREIQFNG